MRHNTFGCGSWVEALENRRLLSASADALVLDALSAQQAFLMSPMVTSPNIVGTFTGTDTNSEERGTGTLSVVVTTQTHTDHLDGIVISKWPHHHSNVNAFTGKIAGKSFTLNMDDGTVATGSASNHGRTLTGTVKSFDGSTGSFSVSR